MCLIPFTFWLLLHDSLSEKVGNTTAKFIQMDKAKVTDFYQLSFRAHNYKRRVFQAGIPGINSWPQILFCCFGFFFFKYMEKLSIKKSSNSSSNDLTVPYLSCFSSFSSANHVRIQRDLRIPLWEGVLWTVMSAGWRLDVDMNQFLLQQKDVWYLLCASGDEVSWLKSEDGLVLTERTSKTAVLHQFCRDCSFAQKLFFHKIQITGIFTLSNF